MPTKLSFKEALERQGKTPVERPAESGFHTRNVALFALGPIEQPVEFARLLSAHGASLKRARLALDRLAQRKVIVIPLRKGGLDAFLLKALKMNVRCERRA